MSSVNGFNSSIDYRVDSGTKNAAYSLNLQVTRFEGGTVEDFFGLVLLLVAAWAVNYFGDVGDFSPKAYRDHRFDALIKAGDECVAISERATAHMIPKLEFQKLELAGRKANVVVRCMADHHFYQNPAWLKYSEPIAAKLASQQHISTDEAIENLKRSDMLVFQQESNKPIYWQHME